MQQNAIKPAQDKQEPTSLYLDIAPHKVAQSSDLDKLCIRGGNELRGTINISGAKNAALKLMCASLLTEEPLILENMPVHLGDIKTLAGVLQYTGVRVGLRRDGVAELCAQTIETPEAPYDLVRKMRASVLVLGPMLARMGEAKVSLPGGCAIGTRPVDFHIEGLRAMGADITVEQGNIIAKAPNGLYGGEYTFPRVSHTGTENLMMAATLAKGTTILRNCAREPEVSDLGQCLIAMGAKIEGLGTNQITIHGVQRLHGATHQVLSDRIETGTWLIAVGLTGGELILKNASLDHLQPLLSALSAAGIQVQQETSDDGEAVLRVWRKGDNIQPIDIMTEPHPGFPTDLQAQMMALLTLAKGASMVTETIFENRFMHVPELNRLGANIHVQGNSAIIRGVDTLHGAHVMATDLRASVALVLAALAANGETIIDRIYHLERGYENIVQKLSQCGADISRLRG